MGAGAPAVLMILFDMDAALNGRNYRNKVRRSEPNFTS
jgi:hypothetical protein